MSHYSHLSTPELLQKLGTSNRGLSQSESKIRLSKYGLNEIEQTKKLSALGIFIAQFKNALSLLLIGAGLLSVFLGETLESIGMFSIVIINAILGFVEEYRADKAMEELAKKAAPFARVLRDGVQHRIPAIDLVPGDLIIFEAGDVVAADSRIVEASSLQVDEASLTGESLPVEKNTDTYAEDLPMADKLNLAFMGTNVTYGKARAVVVTTGMSTEFGKISTSLMETEEVQTPLQKKFESLAQQIGKIAVVLIGLVFIAGTIWSGYTWSEMLLISLALAVATIPVALPTVVTVGLAVGSKVLAAKKMLIRKLPAAESLGAATIICSDKTGTMTKNEMTVTTVYANHKSYSVTGSGYETKGQFVLDEAPADWDDVEPLLRASYLCNNAKVVQEDNKTEVFGDPTEVALLVLGKKAGLSKDGLTENSKFLVELPFDSDRKRMSVLYQEEAGAVAYVKGAPDILLGLCDKVRVDGEVVPLDQDLRESILSHNNSYAKNALRVIAVASRELEETSDYSVESVERNLVFLGLVGMMDPPRDEVKQAVKKCHEAGIEVMMITGDHMITAQAVGKEIGLFTNGDLVVTSQEVEKWDDVELDSKVDKIKILARAHPIQKLRIVESLQRNGHIVAMTGDGINDAPALKKADVGISMGINGTDVSRQASKAVLTNDDFATIVNAIGEGRNIYDKMIKSAKYLLSCNSGEIMTILFSILIGFPLPLVPLQILMINVLTDALPALGLGLESAEPGVMKRSPRHPEAKPISTPMFISIVLMGFVMCLATLFIFVQYLDQDLAKARTAAFTTLVMVQLFAVMSSRSLKPSLSKLNPFSNPWLLGGVAISLLMHIVVVYWPPMQIVFETVPLSGMDWLKILGVSSIGFVIMEMSKFSLKKNPVPVRSV